MIPSSNWSHASVLDGKTPLPCDARTCTCALLRVSLVALGMCAGMRLGVRLQRAPDCSKALWSLLYPCVPVVSGCLGYEHVQDIGIRFNIYGDGSTAPSKEVIALARFCFNTSITPLVQAVAASAALGMLQEYQNSGNGHWECDDDSSFTAICSFVNVSGIVFALSMCSSVYAVAARAFLSVRGFMNQVIRVEKGTRKSLDEYIIAIDKRHSRSTVQTRNVCKSMLPMCLRPNYNTYLSKGCTHQLLGSQVYNTTTLVGLRPEMHIVAVAAALSAAGALLLAIAVASTYYDVVLLFDEKSVSPIRLQADKTSTTTVTSKFDDRSFYALLVAIVVRAVGTFMPLMWIAVRLSELWAGLFWCCSIRNGRCVAGAFLCRAFGFIIFFLTAVPVVGFGLFGTGMTGSIVFNLFVSRILSLAIRSQDNNNDNDDYNAVRCAWHGCNPFVPPHMYPKQGGRNGHRNHDSEYHRVKTLLKGARWLLISVLIASLLDIFTAWWAMS